MREANLGCPSAGTIKLEFRTADQKLVGETGPVPATVLITHAYRNAKQVVDINSIWFLEALFDETSLVLVCLRGDAPKYSGKARIPKNFASNRFTEAKKAITRFKILSAAAMPSL